MALGLSLQAIGLGWIAAVGSPTTPYADFVAPFVISGIGMALFFAPVANVVLSALIKVFTTGDLLDALRDAGHDPDLA